MNLNKAFVIVKPFGVSNFEYFAADFITVNKSMCDIKCDQLNATINKQWADHNETKNAKKKNYKPWEPILVYKVLPMDEALKEYHDMVADTYTE